MGVNDKVAATFGPGAYGDDQALYDDQGRPRSRGKTTDLLDALRASLETAPTTSAGAVLPPPAPAETTSSLPLVVGLDLSLASTGIAHARGLDVVTDTLVGQGRGVPRLRYLAQLVRHHCKTAELVVIEAPSPHMGKSAGYHERAGLHWMVLERLHLDGRVWVEVQSSVIKKYATGKGAHPGLGKGPMVEATTRRFPLVQTGGDDNQCDALWLAALGVDHLTGAHVVPQAHRAVLGSVTWPVRHEQPPPRRQRAPHHLPRLPPAPTAPAAAPQKPCPTCEGWQP